MTEEIAQIDLGLALYRSALRVLGASVYAGSIARPGSAREFRLGLSAVVGRDATDACPRGAGGNPGSAERLVVLSFVEDPNALVMTLGTGPAPEMDRSDVYELLIRTDHNPDMWSRRSTAGALPWLDEICSGGDGRWYEAEIWVPEPRRALWAVADCLAALSATQAALDDTVRRAKAKRTFGKPLLKWGAIQDKLVSVAAGLQVYRSFCYEMSWALGTGRPIQALVGTTVGEIADFACGSLQDCMEIFGGAAWREDHPVFRRYAALAAWSLFADGLYRLPREVSALLAGARSLDDVI